MYFADIEYCLEIVSVALLIIMQTLIQKNIHTHMKHCTSENVVQERHKRSMELVCFSGSQDIFAVIVEGWKVAVS